MLSARRACIAAAAMLAEQPCLGTEDLRESGTGEVRTGAFAGISLRVLLDDSPSARRATARPGPREGAFD